MPAAGFTLKLGEGDRRISMETLKEALENALEMLRSVGRDFIPAGTDVRWEVVKASLKSPLCLTFAPRFQNDGAAMRTAGRRIAAACVNGFADLEKEAASPPHFDEDALLAVEKLVRVAQKDGAKLAVASGRAREVAPTSQVVDNIRKVVEKARTYLDYGTLEGRLEEVSIHVGPHFTIWESLTKHRVECVVTTERLEEAKALLGQRVAVSGRVRYRNHKPITIQVESVRRLRDARELPQLEDMPPIDIADGLSPEEYVRRMRDAQ